MEHAGCDRETGGCVGGEGDGSEMGDATVCCRGGEGDGRKMGDATVDWAGELKKEFG